jgi:hypothetical protein
MMMHP